MRTRTEIAADLNAAAALGLTGSAIHTELAEEMLARIRFERREFERKTDGWGSARMLAFQMSQGASEPGF